MLRTHTCGELSKKEEGKKVKLAGWVNSLRTHGKVSFVDLRDRYGITQLFFNEKLNLNRESVIQVEGVVKKKPQANEKLKTGEIEVNVSNWELLNKSDSLPLEIEGVDSTEETRLKYRYLDLRSKKMQHNLILRYKVGKEIRNFMDKEGFLELETPFLAKSTPEGARDYLVPSRVNKGNFFALPQSPQLFKQLFMVSGYDKYFQIVKCFRDEDLRKDRQPEFTQIDIEMSFIEENDIYDLLERMMKHVFEKILNKKIKIPFERITFDESMKKYQADKPDLRKKGGEEFKFAWVVDFPMFEYNAEEKRYKAMHHPFTSPKDKDIKNMSKNPEKVKAKAYDLVLNGWEIGGGSIRIHNPDVQMKVFNELKIGK
ncbi:aspartate--tRNA ligase, partial [archaeon]|nr:aspartate--tRNA ligase [archaeon]